MPVAQPAHVVSLSESHAKMSAAGAAGAPGSGGAAGALAGAWDAADGWVTLEF